MNKLINCLFVIAIVCSGSVFTSCANDTYDNPITPETSLPLIILDTDGWELYRRLQASQPDHSVSICSVGFLTCIAQLLESEADEYSPLNGVELTLSQRGTVSLTPNIETIFTPLATGNCRYQLVGSDYWGAQMLEKIRAVTKRLHSATTRNPLRSR